MYIIDFETRSEADVTKVGSWVYSQDPTTDVICACWMGDDNLDDAIVQWTPDYAVVTPPPGTYLAYNVSFERAIWENICVPRYGWPEDVEWLDMAAMSSYLALPRGLGSVLNALGLGAKEDSGKGLITKYSKLYLKTAKRDIPEEDLRQFIEYCAVDVKQTRKLYHFLNWLPEAEEARYNLHQSVAHYGFHLDRKSLTAAYVTREAVLDEVKAEFHELTGLSPNQRDAFLRWCAEKGQPLENLQAAYVSEVLPTLTGEVATAVRLRQDVAKTSTSKLDAMLRQCGSDDRARYQTIYHGTRTGREAGVGIQPLNFPRGWEDSDPDTLVENINHGSDWLRTIYGKPIGAISAALRHYITASPGHTLYVGDFVSIEAVVLAALAGNEKRLDLFRAGGKVYERTADAVFRLPPGTVTKDTHPKERQVGKICELACGYQGALGAWRRFDTSDTFTDEEVKTFVNAWREENSDTVDFWRELERAALHTVRTGELQDVGQLQFQLNGSWLSIFLPNEKRIWYFDPKIRMQMPMWHSECDFELGCNCKPRATVTYMNPASGAWVRDSGYGGKWAENITQAVARELLYDSMQVVVDRGWHKPPAHGIVLSVYDEIVLDHPPTLPEEEFKAALLERSPWCADWPVGVDVWTGPRYKK